MHLLKFKSNDKKEDHTDDDTSKEKIAERTPQKQKKATISSNTEQERNERTVDSQKENQIIQASEPDIPSSKELLTAFEELAAYIYQLEFNRDNKYDLKENRRKD